MKEKRSDIFSAVAFFLFAVFVYVGSYWIPATTSDILGSRFFPKAVAVLIGILAVMQIIFSVSKIKKLPAEESEKTEKKEGKRINKPLFLTTAALFVYYVLVLQIGFTITSILYLLFEGSVLMQKEDLKNKKKMTILVLVAVIVPIFINTIFWKVFSIALPAGALF